MPRQRFWALTLDISTVSGDRLRKLCPVLDYILESSIGTAYHPEECPSVDKA